MICYCWWQSNYHNSGVTSTLPCREVTPTLWERLATTQYFFQCNPRWFPTENLLHWLSRIIAVSGQIITKIWLWGLISDHILSSNKTNCVRDHKKSNFWANFLIIQWLFMILGIIQWLSWLFSDNWWLFMIIQHKSWLFTANQVSPWNAGR